MEQVRIDRRKNYYIVLDIEGTNTTQDALCYDLGCAVIDKQGNVYDTLDLVIYDIYALEKELMKSAYYAKKLPQYEEELEDGIRTMVSIFTAKKLLKELCDKYQVKAIMAHNARYDYFGLNTTMRYITKSQQRYFFPYGVEIWDTQKMAHDTICKQKKYIKFCEENGYMTKHKNPRPQEKAEIIYRYISGNNEFVERHTGLSDVMIEKEIFVRCLRQHKKMRKCLFEK